VSAHRLPAHTAAGGFATLVVMVPWKILEACGLPEGRAAALSAGLLLMAAIAALALRRAPFAQKQFPLKLYRETFQLSMFLQAFGIFALAELALVGGLYLFLSAHPT